MQNEYVLEGTTSLRGMSSAYPPSYSGHCAPHSTYIRRSSPPGSPGPRKCCFDSAGDGAGPAGVERKDQPAAGILCCCYSCPGVKKRASVLASLGVCFLVIGYTVIGAFTFMALEGGVHHDTPIAASKHPVSHHPSITDLRSRTVDKLWSITENLNILYRENWTRLAADEVLEFQESLVRALVGWGGSGPAAHTAPSVLLDHKHRWSFSSSFLYSLTLITTIGYGSVSPRTAWGKLVTIIYALVGIPLMLVYLSTTGDVLARSFRRLYGKMCGVTPAKAPGGDCPCSTTVKVPITLCLILVLSYICCGAVLFHRLENWSMLEGSYFCFTSLGTIGFGDLVPGQHAEEVSLCACSIYILAGMALVAMCVSLVQEEASSLLRLIGASCATTAHPSKDPLSDDIPMSLVS